LGARSTNATHCPNANVALLRTPLSFYSDFSFTGNIVVVDAPPFPTFKDQCKNGGWRNFGSAFRNQGQCVAFVERGPKP
jgi:hypothetical protein